MLNIFIIKLYNFNMIFSTFSNNKILLQIIKTASSLLVKRDEFDTTLPPVSFRVPAERPASAVCGQGALRRSTWCHRGPLRAVGPGVANARGSVPHVRCRSAGPVRHGA